jgi:hypothetical protein
MAARPRRDARPYHRSGEHIVAKAVPYLIQRVADPNIPDASLTPLERTVRGWRLEILQRKAPLSPEAAVQEFVSLLKPYRVREVIGDRYSEELIRERFRAYGVPYEIARWSRSDLYVELLPLLTSRRARLLDQSRLTAQLLSLERRTGASGRDAITHPRDGHDDVANAVAGALVHVSRQGHLGFEGWRPYVPEPAPARPPLVEVIERAWHTCPKGCGWQRLDGALDPNKCPVCNPRGPTGREVLCGF